MTLYDEFIMYGSIIGAGVFVLLGMSCIYIYRKVRNAWIVPEARDPLHT